MTLLGLNKFEGSKFMKAAATAAFWVLSIALLSVFSFLFYSLVPLLDLFEVLPQVLILISVICAAVLIRLNRGIPDILWDEMPNENSRVFLSKFVRITRHYIFSLSWNVLTIIIIVVLQIAGTSTLVALPVILCKLISGFLGFLLSVILLYAAYIIRKDMEIIEDQRKAIMFKLERERSRELNKIRNDLFSRGIGGPASPAAPQASTQPDIELDQDERIRTVRASVKELWDKKNE